MEYLGPIILLLGIWLIFFIFFGLHWLLCYLYKYLFKKNYPDIIHLAVTSMFIHGGLVMACAVVLPEEIWEYPPYGMEFQALTFLTSPFVSDALIKGLPALRRRLFTR